MSLFELKKENKIEFLYKHMGTIYGVRKYVLLGDVLHFGEGIFKYRNHPFFKYNIIKNDTKYTSPEDIILELWTDKSLTIESQSEKLINYVYEVVKIVLKEKSSQL